MGWKDVCAADAIGPEEGLRFDHEGRTFAIFRNDRDEYFCTESGAKAGVTFENTSATEPLVCLRYFGPEVNPDAPAMGAYRKNSFA